MSSLGKSIGRIQSAPPDEGEPHLKPALNQDAQEFNPLSWQSKGPKALNANANDYKPETTAGSFVPSYGNQNYNKGFKPKHFNPYFQGYPANHHVYNHYANQNFAYPPVQNTSKPEPASFFFNADTPDFQFSGFTGDKVDSIPEFEVAPTKADEKQEKTEEKIETVEEKSEPIEHKPLAEAEGNPTVNGELKIRAEEAGEKVAETETREKPENLEEKPKNPEEAPEKPEEVPEKPEEVPKSPEEVPGNLQKDLEETKEIILEIRKRVYDFDMVKNFKFEFVRDPNFLVVPEHITRFKDREVQEIRISKQNKAIDRKPSELQIKVVFWRKPKTAEEQKISDKAKEYNRRFTVTADEQEKIKKTIKVTLNKLSPNNLEKLMNQILETCRKSHDCLKLVVSGIFEKAWSEKKYTQMYSDICKMLKTQFEGFRYPDQDSSKLPNTKNYFKFELLYMCEETFIKTPQLEDLSSLNEEQRKERLAKIKEKTLGNVRFIGELFNVNLITAKIVLECVNSLLNLFESENNEDRLEGACLLLQTGGASFERSKVVQETNQIYQRLDHIAATEISKKNKFKIMDLKDFREGGWKSLQKGLKKVEEIHADHLQEKEEIKRRHGY